MSPLQPPAARSLQSACRAMLPGVARSLVFVVGRLSSPLCYCCCVFLCVSVSVHSVQQVAFADKILLNKTDLVAAADKANVIKRIRVRRHRAQA